MKQKMWCFGDDFAIKDEDGREAFYVDGKVFTLRETLVMKDGEGTEVATIRKRLLSWGPTYEIDRGSAGVTVVKKAIFTLFHCKFEVDVPGPEDLEAKGDFIDKEYVFRQNGREVAAVSKRWFSWTDTYGIEVARGVDPVTVLASAVVIDMCCHADKKD